MLSHTNALIVNLEKTELLCFQLRNNNNEKLILQYDGIDLIPKECVRFLGVCMDQSLRWCSHIDHISKKLNSSFYAIRQIKDSLPQGTIINVYYSLVYSHLNYCVLLWGNSIESKRIFIAQKRIIRMIFGLDPRTTCKPSFIANKLMTVSCIFLYRCLKYVKENEQNFIKVSSFHDYATRNSETLGIPLHRTSKFETSPLYHCIKIYNHLPPKMKALNPRNFGRVVKDLMFKKSYYTVEEYLSDDLI